MCLDPRLAQIGRETLTADERMLVDLLRTTDEAAFSLIILRRREGWTVSLAEKAPPGRFRLGAGATFGDAWGHVRVLVPAIAAC